MSLTLRSGGLLSYYMPTSDKDRAWELMALFSLTWARLFGILALVVGAVLTSQLLLALTFGILAIVFKFISEVAEWAAA
jgi:hypothetical protein